MTIKNVKIVLTDKVIEKGYISFENGVIKEIKEGECNIKDAIDGKGNIVMPGFIDIHIHGSCGIDFMDAKKEEYKIIADALYKEGVTTFLATTLTSDKESLVKVCEKVKEVKNEVPSLGGIHLEGPYICVKYKGAQNEAFIRNPDINELKDLIKASNNNVRYISMAPEKEGAFDFIKEATKLGVVCSAGHTEASFDDVEKAIKVGLTNTTHTHNAMSPHHHRNPGVVTAAFNFDSLYTEFICDYIHVCPNTLKTSYKIIGPERFIVITDALKGKHSDIEHFELFGLPCIKKNGAAYLEAGPLAGSLLTMDQGLRNMYELGEHNLSNLAKITSRNAAKAIHFDKIGEIKEGYNADFVILSNELKVLETYKNGKKVY